MTTINSLSRKVDRLLKQAEPSDATDLVMELAKEALLQDLALIGDDDLPTDYEVQAERIRHEVEADLTPYQRRAVEKWRANPPPYVTTVRDELLAELAESTSEVACG